LGKGGAPQAEDRRCGGALVHQGTLLGVVRAAGCLLRQQVSDYQPGQQQQQQQFDYDQADEVMQFR